jgi:hypothetical protein
MWLPPEIHRLLFDYLEDVDRVCLLLTCKYFSRIASTVNIDGCSVQVGAELLRINQGFTPRVPKRLNLCMKCGIMRSRDSTYWEPHRSGWNFRQLIPIARHRQFADAVNAWADGRSNHCPRCFDKFVAQGNLQVGEIPLYGNRR